MEISTIVTGIVVAALIIVPFFLMAFAGNKKSILLDKVFDEASKKEALNFALKEKINESWLGLDFNKNVLLAVSLTEGNPDIRLIQLSKVKQVSFFSPETPNLQEVNNQRTWLSFVSAENGSEENIILYKAVEYKPILQKDIIAKGMRWEELLRKRLRNPQKPKSPNYRKSA